MEKAKDILKSLLVLPIGVVAFYLVRYIPYSVLLKMMIGVTIVNLYTYIVTEMIDFLFHKLETLD